MGLTAQQRGQIISELIGNCDCWKEKEDKDLLNSFSDAKLLTLKQKLDKDQQILNVANAAVAGFNDKGSGNAYRLNPETGKWEKSQTVENKEEPKKEEKKENPFVNKGSEQTVTNSDKKPRTVEEFLKSAPPELRNQIDASIRVAQEIEQREKDKLIAQILANVNQASKQAHYQRLINRSVDELRSDLELIPKIQPTEEKETQKVVNRRPVQQQDDDILIAPKLDWAEVNSGSVKQSGVTNRQEEIIEANDTMTEEEWLQHAPPHIRNRYQTAAAIEAQEKRKLIAEIVANIDDEDQEKRLTARLSNMTVDAIRDFLALTPKKETPRPNYFGASVPSTRSVANDASEDVLPLPRINWAEEMRNGR